MVLNIKRFSVEEHCDEDLERYSPAKPFKHQVGGHTPLSYLPNGHLLKPCDERELLFYRSMPAQLLPLAPRCCSTIQGSSTLCLPNCCSNCLSTIEEDIDISIPKYELRNNKRRMISRNYIVLCDLTRGFSQPCVLDLKLGTRQHGDAASAEKVLSQTKKCNQTTSSTMGIRLCGMQYARTSGELVLMDKYAGRELDAEGLLSSVKRFFKSRPESVELVENYVTEIKEILQSLDGVRLFGSSLLIVIEADPSVPVRSEVRLVDFANATCKGFLDDSEYSGPDEGSLLGLQSLQQMLTIIQQ